MVALRIGTPIPFLEAIKQAMFEEMERDPAVVLIGEDVGVYGGAFKTSEGLLERFGWERVIDAPISESAIIGAACGIELLRLAPHLRNAIHRLHCLRVSTRLRICRQGTLLVECSCAMVIRGPSGGGVHGGPFPLRESGNVFLCTRRAEGHLIPRTPYDAKGLLKAAVRVITRCSFSNTSFFTAASKARFPPGLHRAHRKAVVRREGKTPDHPFLCGDDCI